MELLFKIFIENEADLHIFEVQYFQLKEASIEKISLFVNNSFQNFQKLLFSDKGRNRADR